MPLLVVLSLGMSLTFNTAIAMAAPKDKKNHHDHDEVSVQVVFGERDRGIIREYCSQPHSGLPPGLAKRNGKPSSRSGKTVTAQRTITPRTAKEM